MNVFEEQKMVFQSKLDELLKQQSKEIDEKVAQFRASLESQVSPEVSKLRRLIESLSEIIQINSEEIKVEDKVVEVNLEPSSDEILSMIEDAAHPSIEEPIIEESQNNILEEVDENPIEEGSSAFFLNR